MPGSGPVYGGSTQPPQTSSPATSVYGGGTGSGLGGGTSLSTGTGSSTNSSVLTFTTTSAQTGASGSPTSSSGPSSSGSGSQEPGSVIPIGAGGTYAGGNSSTSPSTGYIPPATASSTIASGTGYSSTPSGTGTPSGNTTIPFLRGVNLGGWLVLEKWMNGDVFTGAFSDAADQYTFDSISGAPAALDQHWSTWFNETDIQALSATGINALRIPIGYWAYDNTGTPYQKGADVYLEKAIGWARTAGMKVWIDCHGSPGSQNGFDNSGHSGAVHWQEDNNLNLSISVLETIATKYGTAAYADVVVGIELTNEPVSSGNNQFSVTKSWAQEAYAAVKAVSTNPNLLIVMHDAFQGPKSWISIGEKFNANGAKNFGMDTHLYQVFTDSDMALNQAQHISEACSWGANIKAGNAVMPTYVGEWSPATNICVNPDGSTTAGTDCSEYGCQCQSADIDDWNANMVEQVRRYVEAQMDTFEQNGSGYFMWAAKGPGGWGFLNGVQKGFIPNPVTARKYPGQCSGNSGSKVRREVRERSSVN
ncbi:hypothetical protein B7494_g5397 [Chlorociboria aeruginascens]|nr:hypothetical protein B7494_g5397 [Chlorociboria aeruginascens]